MFPQILEKFYFPGDRLPTLGLVQTRRKAARIGGYRGVRIRKGLSHEGLSQRQFDAPHSNPSSPGRGAENLDDAGLSPCPPGPRERGDGERGLGGEGNGAVIELTLTGIIHE